MKSIKTTDAYVVFKLNTDQSNHFITFETTGEVSKDTFKTAVTSALATFIQKFPVGHHTIQEIGYEFGVNANGDLYKKMPLDFNIGESNQVTEGALKFFYDHIVPPEVKVAGDEGNSVISNIEIS